MNILYASYMCSDKEFKKIFDICSEKPIQSIQKFNKLLCAGIVSDKKNNLEILTSAPVNSIMCKKRIWGYNREIENNIKFNYCFMINVKIIKFITLFISALIISFVLCLKNIKNKENSVIIYDAFYPVVSTITYIVGKLFRYKIVGLYTDLPICMQDNLENKNNIKKKIFNYIDKLSNKLSDGFILLTEQMNEVVNTELKPYIVMEGLVDKKINIENSLKKKTFPKTIVYAGGLYEKFGIGILVEAMNGLEKEDIQLVLYGNGEMAEKVNNLPEKFNIKYGGVLYNDEIVKIEVEASLLVNPRFTNERYTKYSFPSKNMEYMVSGTPLLTTRLPGMPKEYNEYVYLIEEENPEGIREAILNVFKSGEEAMFEKGKKAKDFVLKEKNNFKQAERLIIFCKGVVNKNA